MRTNLTSLERLERQLQVITPDRAQGDAWEKALKGWINAGGHPELTKAWMWGEWPGKLKAGLKGDKGVDLVAETRDKQLVAIQVKFRRDPNDPVTAPEVQKLVGSYRKHFALFALASNAWSATRGVSEAVGDEDAMLILREQLLESNYDWATKKSIKRTKFTPFPFQKVAAESVRKALAKGGRAQIVMACGTGKTVTMLLAAEALDAQRVLVLAPTLLLVKQLRDEWVSKRRPDREWASLAVCSDIGDGMDASEIAPAEFGAPPTTNPDEIAAFLKKPGRRVVFGTYASSDRIAKAQKKAGVPSFDLAVADEAHRIAGVVAAKDKSERSQRVMLEEKEIKAVRRLFATATPRITGSKKTRDGDDILIESMDDESRFGKVAHSVTFQEAVKLKRLVPYKLVVTIVTNDEVADAVQNRRFIDVKGKPYAADEVATAIAIRRAYKELGISKIISYHSRVAGARSFADLITQVPGRGTSPVTEHVAGSMPVNDRKQVLNRLAAATEPYLVTNARCLTEGIDVPALDAVAFADPRKSQVDIVQAVGRAMRRPMGKSKKTTGYIILPVYLTKKELKDPETAVEGSAFEPVLQVLRALKDHDPFMAKFMAKILVAKGKKPHRKEGGIREILKVSIQRDLEADIANKLRLSIQLRAIEVSAGSFEVGLLHLKEFLAERLGSFPKVTERCAHGNRVGSWLHVQRQKERKLQLSPQEKEALSRLGVSWTPLQAQRDRAASAFQAFFAREGHCQIPVTHTENGFRLGLWASNQRRRKKRGTISTDVQEMLQKHGFIWDTFEASWQERYVAVQKEIVNGAKIHEELTFSPAIRNWLQNQRLAHRKGKLSLRRRKYLALLGIARTWYSKRTEVSAQVDIPIETILAGIQDYRDRTNRRGIPASYQFKDLPVGAAIVRLRRAERAGKLDLKIKQSLIHVGIKFGVPDRWNHMFSLLTLYRRVNGHANVPLSEEFKGEKLGLWLKLQRKAWRQGQLSPERVEKLSSLKLIRDPKQQRDSNSWDHGMSGLRVFKRTYGHCDVPMAYKYDGFNLGYWLSNKRGFFRRGILPRWQEGELRELGVSFEPRSAENWEHWLGLLREYIQEFGDVNIPTDYVVNGAKLGMWLAQQKSKLRSGTLSESRWADLSAAGVTKEKRRTGRARPAQ